MCGRYVRSGDKQKIAEYFHANPQPAELAMLGADLRGSIPRSSVYRRDGRIDHTPGSPNSAFTKL